MTSPYGTDPMEPTEAQVEEHLNSQVMTSPEEYKTLCPSPSCQERGTCECRTYSLESSPASPEMVRTCSKCGPIPLEGPHVCKTSPEEVLNGRIKIVQQNIEGLIKAKEALEKDGNDYFMLSEFNLKTENERLSELLTLQSILAMPTGDGFDFYNDEQSANACMNGRKSMLSEVRALIEKGVK